MALNSLLQALHRRPVRSRTRAAHRHASQGETAQVVAARPRPFVLAPDDGESCNASDGHAAVARLTSAVPRRASRITIITLLTVVITGLLVFLLAWLKSLYITAFGESGMSLTLWDLCRDSIAGADFQDTTLTLVGIAAGLSVTLAAISHRVLPRPQEGTAQLSWLEGVMTDAARESLVDDLMYALTFVTGVCAVLFTFSVVVSDGGPAAGTVLLAVLLLIVFWVMILLPDVLTPTANGTMAGYARALIAVVQVGLWWYEHAPASGDTSSTESVPLRKDRAPVRELGARGDGAHLRPAAVIFLITLGTHLVSGLILFLVYGRGAALVIAVSAVLTTDMAAVGIAALDLSADLLTKYMKGDRGARRLNLIMLVTLTATVLGLTLVVVATASRAVWPVRIVTVIVWVVCHWWILALWGVARGHLGTLQDAALSRRPVAAMIASRLHSASRAALGTLAAYDAVSDLEGADEATRAAIANVILPDGSRIVITREHPAPRKRRWGARSSTCESSYWSTSARLASADAYPAGVDAREALRALNQLLRPSSVAGAAHESSGVAPVSLGRLERTRTSHPTSQ